MDPRARLEQTLRQHRPTDEKETRDLEVMLRHLQALQEPFARSCFPAHFTASAIVVDKTHERLVLVQHKKLARWLQPGGHFEALDQGHGARAAEREAREETGLDVRFWAGRELLLDVDVHTIPARRDEPEHDHLDLRYLLVAEEPEALQHDPNESHGARWHGFDEAILLVDDQALVRLLRKARRG